MKLFISASTKFLFGLALMGALLFLPAGTFNYANAWLFIILLFVPILILGAVLFIKSPDLLKKRLDSKEKEATQKSVVSLIALFFLAGFIVAGFDYRYNWSYVPTWLVITSSCILLISYGLYAEVMRENAYLSRTVKVQEGQSVINTGLYKIVRHPMYAATIWLFLSIPLVLGSLWALLCFLPYLPLIIVRIINEEKVLEKELNGYSEYKKHTKYRLIPFIW